MIRAIIVEDEGVAARRLSAMLGKIGVIVLSSLKSNKDFREYIKENEEPDIYFLDVHLNDGIIFESLQVLDLKSPIVFTTAYDEFAIKAFKQNSVDYLLKPFNQIDLQNALDKYEKLYHKKKVIDLQTLSQYFRNDPVKLKTRIRIKIGDRYKSMKLEEVPLIYSLQRSTFITSRNGRSFPIEQSLEQISAELDSFQFLQVNRGHIVNIDFIKEVISYSNSRLKVIIKGFESTEIIVARERVKKFKEWLG